jgi:hypothetical protein
MWFGVPSNEITFVSNFVKIGAFVENCKESTHADRDVPTPPHQHYYWLCLQLEAVKTLNRPALEPVASNHESNT